MSELRLESVAWTTARKTLLSIRCEVFVEEQGVPPEMEEDAADPEGYHLLAFLPGSGPVGTGRLLADGHIGRVAVREPFRGRGIGSKLLAALIQEARQSGLSAVFLHAQCDATPFYQRQGFVPKGEVFEEAGILHRKMHLDLGSRV